jgi:regulatory protein
VKNTQIVVSLLSIIEPTPKSEHFGLKLSNVFSNHSMTIHQQSTETPLLLQKIRHYCSYQERCIREVEQKLKELTVQRKKIPDIINQLQKEGYLNEERFAKAFAGGKFRLNKWGRNRIEYEMKVRGIPELMIQEGMAEIGEEEYLQTLRDLMIHKYDEIKTKKNVNIREKIINFAYGKGYEIELILVFIKEMKI